MLQTYEDRNIVIFDIGPLGHDHNEGWAAGHRLYQCLGVVYIEWRLSNIDTAPFLAVNNGPGADKNKNMAAAELKYGLWWTLNPRVVCLCRYCQDMMALGDLYAGLGAGSCHTDAPHRASPDQVTVHLQLSSAQL